MAKAPFRRGGREGGIVDRIAMEGDFVVVHISTGKKVTLNPEKDACRVEKEDEVVIDYFISPAFPLVKFIRADEEIYSEAVPAVNIQPIIERFF
ncbi:MAG: hypothetical protein WC831_05645 [Parcubacteria group bacterium]|jgi:hypothetical protein